MEQTTPKGATMLKVTGILMIIGGAISIIVSILAIIGIAAIAYLSDGSASLGLLYASGALLIVSSVAELIAGILGTANCKKPEKAKTCLAWGIVVAVLAVAGIILNAIGGGGFSVLSLSSRVSFSRFCTSSVLCRTSSKLRKTKRWPCGLASEIQIEKAACGLLFLLLCRLRLQNAWYYCIFLLS